MDGCKPGAVDKNEQTCAERKGEGPRAVVWHEKLDSEEASWNDGIEEEEEEEEDGSTRCIPKI